MKMRMQQLQQQLSTASSQEYNGIQRQLAHLRAERSELQSRIQIMMKDSDRLQQTSLQRQSNATQGTYRTVAPEVYNLKTRLQQLVDENRSLVSRA